MPQYLHPGVYVEEVPSSVQTIAGAGTSTAGFIGLTVNNVVMPEHPSGGNYTVAPAGEAQLVTRWGEFKSKFGDIADRNRVLANAVYGFFNNGGTRCWVIRVTDLNVAVDGGGGPDVDQIKDALVVFEAIDEVAIVALPLPSDVGAGADNQARRVAIRGMALSHCELMQDRFAILDGEEIVDGDLTPQNIYPNAGGEAVGQSSEYGAVYFPWIDVSGTGEFMPPSGHTAGVYARVDGLRGVHKAPANEAVRGALGVRYRVSKILQDGLNPGGINAIRPFNGNILVWGARTVGGDENTEFKYVSVRRLLNFMKESIEDGTRWVVFEPNDAGLWAKITRNINAFLTVTWRSGALFGATPQEAFYVKCDADTNPPEIRDLGQVVTEIGVSVVKPAEFVIFRISQWAGPGG